MKVAEQEEMRKNNTDQLVGEVITGEQIAEVISRWTGIPVTKLNQTEKERLLHLGDVLHKRVIGQSEGIAPLPSFYPSLLSSLLLSLLLNLPYLLFVI